MVGNLKNWLVREGDTLTVQGHLGHEEYPEFRAAMKQLVRDACEDATVDLLDVDHMVSPYIGLIAAAAGDLQRLGRRLRVRALGQIHRLLTISGLDKTLTLERPEGWQAPPID